MTDRRWYFADGRVRAGWRILIYLALLFAFFVIGQYAASVLPRSSLGWANYLVLLAAGLLAGWAVLSRLDGRPPGALGFAVTPSLAREVAGGLAVGGGLITLAVVLLLVTGTAVFVPDSGTAGEYLGSLAWTLAYFGLAAAYEEVWFRGYGFQALVEGLGVWPAVIATSAAFSWLHGGNPNVDAVAFFNIFLAGVLLSLAYLRTRSLWFATAVHAGWNWAMASLLAFPVSGLTLIDTPMYDAVERGADWWTGGEFGPEAGLAGTVVLLAGIAWMLRTRSFSESDQMRAMGPIVDRRLPPEEP